MRHDVVVKFDKKIQSYRLCGSPPQWIDHGNEFLIYAELRGLRVLTVRAYAFDLASFFRWLEDDSSGSIEVIRAADYIKFLSYLREGGLAPITIKRQLFTCVRFHEFIFETRPRFPLPVPKRAKSRCQYTPPSLGKLIKVPHRLITPLTPSEVGSFVIKCPRYRDLSIVSLMLFCGLRSNEVLNLKIHDIELRNSTLRVLGKGNRERCVPIREDLVGIIHKYLSIERPKHCETDRLFVALQGDRRGHPMSYWGLRSLFRSRRKGNAKRANPHRFRHTFATDMARAGMKLPILKALLGHSNVETTLTYVNFAMKDLHKEYTRITAVIKDEYEKSTPT